jgi:hypothetical protein
LSSVKDAAARSHSGAAEILALVLLYGAYELIRGFGHASAALARQHTMDVVGLEHALHIFHEREVQTWVERFPGLPGALGLAYITLHFLGTAAALAWIHRSHRRHFAAVRTALVASTGLALAVYVLYPAAPPRLAGLGFGDTVSEHTRVNLSSDVLGALYNPFAAVPSLHFGYALLIGVAVASLARHPGARIAGAAYPAVMLFVIVGTGNHFVFDAAAGAVVTAAGWLLARSVLRTPRLPARPEAAAAAVPAPAGMAAA